MPHDEDGTDRNANQDRESNNEDEDETDRNANQDRESNNEDEESNDENSESSKSDNSSFDNNNNKFVKMLYASTNARSISAKIPSVVEYFEESDLTFMTVTETWLTKSREDKEKLDELKESNSINFISKHRPTRGGGVSIIFDSRRITLSPLPLEQCSGFEVVAAIGKLGNKGRKICIICIYIPPKMKVEQFGQLSEILRDNIEVIKEKHDPVFVISGDMNKRKLFEELAIFPSLRLLETGATRGNAVLDQVITDLDTVVRIRPPLTDINGMSSDHAVMLCTGSFPNNHHFTTREFQVRKTMKDSQEKFGRLVLATNWECVRKDSSSLSAQAFYDVIRAYYDHCYPMVTIKKRSTDLPWVNKKYKKLSRRKKRLFRRRGKCNAWRRVQQICAKELKNCQASYIDRVEKRVEETNNTKAFYEAIKLLGAHDPPKRWSVRDMFPDEDDADICERAADFFNQISAEFTPVSKPIRPENLESSCPLRHQISARLRHFRKPKSQVEGDILSSLFTSFADTLSEPLHIIFTQVYETWEWPQLWQTETVTLIPKKKSPENLSDLRNLSCTPLVSKVLESFVMDSIKETIKLSDNQYGGIKGTSVDNFLIDTWQTILEDLEDHRASSSLISIDFSKAFNRVDHTHCLSALKEMGATTETIGLVNAFLYNRTMRVRVGGSMSTRRQVNGGAPQGCILGGTLFCVATNALMEPKDNHSFANNGTVVSISPISSPAFRDRPVVSPIHPPPRLNISDVSLQSEEDSFNGGFFRFNIPRRINDTVESVRPNRQEIEEFVGETQGWRDRDLKTLVYIDDFNVVEKIRHSDAITTYTQNTAKSHVHAPMSEEFFREIGPSSLEIGMQINTGKTQLLCVSASQNIVDCYIETAEGRIISSDSMKLLGFWFSSKPTVSLHISKLLNKMRARLWSLRHLKRTGMSSDKLRKVYTTVLRPCIEFTSVTYHSMLTSEQTTELERVQLRSFKIIYGTKTSYRQALEISGEDTLQERRERAVLKFAQKMSRNPKYSERWFPKKPPNTAHNLRKELEYKEEHARTERLRMSPLYYMRRTLNNQ